MGHKTAVVLVTIVNYKYSKNIAIKTKMKKLIETVTLWTLLIKFLTLKKTKRMAIKIQCCLKRRNANNRSIKNSRINRKFQKFIINKLTKKMV